MDTNAGKTQVGSFSDSEIESLIQGKVKQAITRKKTINIMAVVGIICAIIALVWDVLLPAIIWFIVFAIWFIVAGRDNKKDIERDRKIEAAYDELTSYDKNTRVLTVKRRSTLIAHLITLEENHDVNVKYEPLKLHVGAVTNGGVTSGGAFTTGGYNYIDSARKNGLCTMYYRGSSVRSIQLTSEMYEAASRSAISRYLDSSEQQIIVEHQREKFVLDHGVEQYQKTGYIGNIAANDGKPTVEKGMMILEWLAIPKK